LTVIATLIQSLRAGGPPTPLLWRLLPPLAVVMSLLIIGAGALLWEQYQTNANARAATFNAEILSDLQGFLDNEASGLAEASQSIAADPRVRQALRYGDSDRLLADWRPVFETLHRENNLTHFNFLDKKRVLLLRIQKPEKHGDPINRFTALEAERTGKTASGIEIGQVGTLVLRVVQPVFQDGKLLGYVELGKEIEDVLQRLHIRRGSHLAAVVKKEYLRRQQWEERMRLLGREADWNRLARNVIIYASQGRLPDAFVPLADHDPVADQAQGSTDREISLDGELWRTFAIPLQDASGAVVGRLLNMADVTAERAAFHRTILVGSLFSGILLALLLGFVFVLLRRTDASIRSEAKKLLESERLYRNIFNNVAEGIFQLSLDGQRRVINPAFARMFGYGSPEEMMAAVTNIGDKLYMHPEDWTWLIELLKTSPLRDFEAQIARKDGSMLWVSINASMAQDTEADISYVEGTCMDITERKLRGEELARKTNLLTGLLDSIPDIVFFKDLNGAYLGCNPEFARYVGRPQEEIVGCTDHDLFPYEIAEFYRENDRIMMESGEPSHNAEWIDYLDGHRRALLDTFKAPLRSADGGIIGVIGVSRDITEPKSVEQRLRESEENFRVFFETVDDIILVGTPEGRIMFANPAVSYKLGYTIDDIETMHILDLHPRELREEAEKIFGAMFRGERETCPLPLQSKTGFLLPVETRVWFGKWSGLDCIFGICKDLSREQEALQKFDRLFRNNPAPMAVSTLPERRFSDINDGFLDTLGFAREEVIGRTALELGIFVQPEKQEEVAEGVAGPGRVSDIELKVRRKDGAILEGLFSGEVIESQGQKMFLTVMVDITQRRKAEEALLESERRYRSLIEDSRDGVYFRLRAGEITDANSSFLEIFGYTREEMNGMNVRELYVDPADRLKFQEEIEEKGFVKDYEIRLRKRDGTEVDCLLTSSVQYGDDGEIVGYRGILRDVTVQKQLQSQLLQAQKMKAIGTLAGGIAHDFNNLLQAIVGCTDLLLMTKGPDDPDLKKLLIIRHAARDGADLVSRILAFSRKTESKVRPVDLNLELLRIESLLRRSLTKMVDVKLVLVEDLDIIDADPTQIEQVVLNLAVNAQQAMPDGGQILIETANVSLRDEYLRTHLEAKPGKYVLLTISDTGVGMAPEVLDRIFEPFFTTKTNGEGTGLGLAMVHGIVVQHQGYIRCYSEPGMGTSFKIYFPVSSADLVLDMAVTRQMPAFGTETILLVDDDERLREMGAEMLGMAGYEVISASSGEDALAIYARSTDEISLVILDLIMPGMGGKRCLEEILRINPDAKVIISSGYSSNGLVLGDMRTGARGFLRKPYDAKDILIAIRKVLDRGTM